MRIDRASSSAFLLGILLQVIPASAAESYLYVPMIRAQAADPATSGTLCSYADYFGGSWWMSTTYLVNTGASVVAVPVLEVLGSSRGPCDSQFIVYPSVVGAFDHCVNEAGIKVVKIGHLPGIAVSSVLQRADLWSTTVPGGTWVGEVSQGTAPLPIFSRLFDPGELTITDSVVVGNRNLDSCFPTSQKYIRRVNVTLVNSGSSTATFQVKANVNGMYGTAAASTYKVDAKTIYQVNDIQLTLPSVAEYRSDDFVWFTITADQPFLSWVSTVMNDPQPKAMPFAVYPSKPIN